MQVNFSGTVLKKHTHGSSPTAFQAAGGGDKAAPASSPLDGHFMLQGTTPPDGGGLGFVTKILRPSRRLLRFQKQTQSSLAYREGISRLQHTKPPSSVLALLPAPNLCSSLRKTPSEIVHEPARRTEMRQKET